MTDEHKSILVRAKKFTAEKSNSPWAVASGGEIVTVTERIDAICKMDAVELLACVNWPSTQQAVKVAIEARLRSLRRQR